MSKELPRYKCHKEVRALKIKEVIVHAPPEGVEYAGGHLMPEDDSYAPVPFTPEWEAKHEPEAGGYYVLYEDGYESFSPAEAFEQGYTRVGEVVCEEGSNVKLNDRQKQAMEVLRAKTRHSKAWCVHTVAHMDEAELDELLESKSPPRADSDDTDK